VVFIGLTPEGGNRLEQIKAFLSSTGIPWPNGYGAAQTLRTLGIRKFPSLLVIGPNGRIAWTDDRGGRGRLQAAIEATLEEVAGL